MKPVLLFALLLALGCGQAPAQDNGIATQPPAPAPAGSEAEQQALMERIEHEARLPPRAAPLVSYARFYAWQQREDGVRKVIAVYVSEPLAQDSGARPGRRWVEETALPLIMDGGCDVLSLSYDVATQRIEHVTCNGDG